MYLSGLDELDRKILELLIENARYSYSEIGERLGISRVAVKSHINALEEQGVIESYTTIINPNQLSGAISCYFEIETLPKALSGVTEQLYHNPIVTQIYRVTGNCRLHVHAVAADQKEMEAFLSETIDSLSGTTHIRTNVILSRIKDVKGLRL